MASVETRGFHYDMELSAGNQCYHWNNNAKSYWEMGQVTSQAIPAAAAFGPQFGG